MVHIKVCFVCFEFCSGNITRQPWKYVYEISKKLQKEGYEVFILTNSYKKDIDNIRIISIDRLFTLSNFSNELYQIVKRENPDIIISLIGSSSFLRFKVKFDIPIIGILTTPLYSIYDVIRVGLKEFIIHYNYLFLHILGSLMPKFIIRKTLNSYSAIVTLSESNKKILDALDLIPPICCVPSSFNRSFLKKPTMENLIRLQKRINPKGLPLFLYYTSPLTLRGTDTLIEAFSLVREKKESILIFLSRMDQPELEREERVLSKKVRNRGIMESVKFHSQHLNPEQIKEYLYCASAVCLPFKIVISDMPVSILESMSVGKPVVSTSIGCISDLLEGRGILVPSNNVKALSNALIKILNDENFTEKICKQARVYMENYPSWEETGDIFIDLIQEQVSK